MPEGPEIRRAADAVAGVLCTGPLVRAFFHFPRLKKYQRRLQGARVADVSTRGKAMLIHFDNDLTMYSHNQLYGRWYVTQGHDAPDTRRSLRVALYTATGSALLYSASSVEMLTADEIDRHPFLARIGPDILDDALTVELLEERLQSAAFRGRSLGALLLDQGFVAGTGNYLRSEILFFARLSHTTRPADLTSAERRRLARQILSLARRAYRTGGVTNPPSRVAQLKRAGQVRHAQHRFAVFGRAGRPCYRCGEQLCRTQAGSRRLYFCAMCQPAPA